MGRVIGMVMDTMQEIALLRAKIDNLEEEVAQIKARTISYKEALKLVHNLGEKEASILALLKMDSNYPPDNRLSLSFIADMQNVSQPYVSKVKAKGIRLGLLPQENNVLVKAHEIRNA